MFYGDALQQIMNDPNKIMRLPHWEASVIIRVQNPDENSKMTHPYLYVESRVNGEIRRVPWVKTFPEEFSDRWEVHELSIIPNDRYMDFSKALFNLKKGKILTREDWNESGQYVIYMSGYQEGVPANEAISKATGIPVGKMVRIAPYFMLKNSQGDFVNWVPSTGDLLSNAWKIVEKPEITGFNWEKILNNLIKEDTRGIILGLDFINR